MTAVMYVPWTCAARVDLLALALVMTVIVAGAWHQRTRRAVIALTLALAGATSLVWAETPDVLYRCDCWWCIECILVRFGNVVGSLVG